MFDNYNAVNCDKSAACLYSAWLDLSLPVMHSVSMTDGQLQRLAKAVKSRRAELGLAQGTLSARGGPGVVTVGKIERAEIQHPTASTLAGLDRSLRWSPGSAAAVLAGEFPRPLAHDEVDPSAAFIAAVEADDRLLPEAREHLIRQYGLLLRVQSAQPEPTVSQSDERDEQTLRELSVVEDIVPESPRPPRRRR